MEVTSSQVVTVVGKGIDCRHPVGDNLEREAGEEMWR